MTNQDAFDKVVRHLLKQGDVSLLNTDEILPTCAYRSPDGKRCAVGCLIPDDQYQSAFEDRPVEFVAERVPALAGLSQSLLMDLQSVHDDTDPSVWESQLMGVADTHGLTMPEVESP